MTWQQHDPFDRSWWELAQLLSLSFNEDWRDAHADEWMAAEAWVRTTSPARLEALRETIERCFESMSDEERYDFFEPLANIEAVFEDTVAFDSWLFAVRDRLARAIAGDHSQPLVNPDRYARLDAGADAWFELRQVLQCSCFPEGHGQVIDPRSVGVGWLSGLPPIRRMGLQEEINRLFDEFDNPTVRFELFDERFSVLRTFVDSESFDAWLLDLSEAVTQTLVEDHGDVEGESSSGLRASDVPFPPE